MNKCLWSPSQESVKSSNMYDFMKTINNKYKKTFNSYNELHKWSVNHIPEFWKEIWNYTKVKYSKKYDHIIDNPKKMPGANWFPGSKLNFAENLLRYKDNNIAIIFKGENISYRKITYNDLYKEVNLVSKAMNQLNIKPGDRIVGFMPNIPETVIAMLAATSLGATWSSCSPDFGIKGVLDRFGQIQPKVLFCANGYYFKGKKIDSLNKINEIIKNIPSIRKTIIVKYIESEYNTKKIKNSISYENFKKIKTEEKINFKQFPFSHPLYIMYSSGTTGLPKCIVQSAGGILIHHLKELILHTNLKRKDKIFYFTTCGWMMWNWLVSSLAVGATIILYDGNPFYPSEDTMWKMVDEEKITVFGTSAGYITALELSGLKPKLKFSLSTLKTILSTGSPLSTKNFDFVYNEIKSDLQLSSISGGTDLNGCFALGNPMKSVYSGELQSIGLGMNVKSFNEKGESIINSEGELVCTSPFPSMPIHFWNDPKNQKYLSAYFNSYKNIWSHGDYIKITKEGGVIVLGRSDATLNPAGVRIGTAEIYRQIETIKEIEDSIVVGQRWNNSERIILFIKLNKNNILSESLKDKIKSTIKENASPRHIPSKIIQIPEIPYTFNMKKVELAVKKTIHNEKIKNKSALKNPESLKHYKNLKELETN